ncbi:tetratricopeptide repeat protein [Oceanivirga salmonicida]|uniref:tetratricopeptide repeat protein n=1 Tax=Oceanivirga salmonicida TaxID=1769291 RepID=UPI000829D930|nr:tetratricopeptide repeat protein [Oceanivirga salmonicida]
MTINDKIKYINESRIKRQELIRDSKTTEEVELLKQMTKYIKEVYGNTSNVTIDILNELGGTSKYIGDYETAINSLVEAREIIANKFSKDCIPYATTTLNLAEVYRFKGDITKLEPLYLQVKKIYDEYDMQKTYEYASICNNLGLYYQDTNRPKEALELHKTSYDILQELVEYKIALATTLNNMALAYRGVGEIEKSDECIKSCLKMYEKEVGKGHAMYSSALNSMAVAMFQKGDLEKALELFEKGLFICEASFGTESINYKKVKENVEMVKETIKLRDKKG